MTMMWTSFRLTRFIGTAVLMIGYVYSSSEVFATEESLLSGRVTSLSGGAVAGVPIRAHRENSNITVSVYTNSRGEFSYPAWSSLSPSSYSVTIELPDFAHAEKDGVTLSS